MTKVHEEINEKDKEVESKKLGVFRVGSSGAVVDSSNYSTQCGRLAQARYLGYQSPPTEEMRVMFNGGLTLESFLEERFKLLGIQISKEQEYRGEIAPGIEISGRPDFELLLDGEVVGVEAKSLASPFSVMKQRRNRFPFLKHMIQAATYMTLLKRDRWLIAIGHYFHVNDRGMKAPPEVLWYELTYEGDLFIITNDEGRQAALPFKKEHISKYYSNLKEGIETKTLVSRPTEHELNVDTYNRCKYCPMQSACNEYENDQITFEQWLARVLTSKEKEQ